MALSGENWDIINKNLFIEGAKYWRTGYFNPKTGEEQYICSEYKRTKCPCSALVRYYRRVRSASNTEEGGGGSSEQVVTGIEESHNEDRVTKEDDDDLLDEDARLNKEKYDVTLVYASPLELHAQFHEVDLMTSKVEEMKEKMTELMIQDPTLEPATNIDKVLNDFTETMDGQEKSELLASFYLTRRESHLRRLRRIKEDEWGKMPTSQQEFHPELMDTMADGTKLLWADSYDDKNQRTLVFTTTYLLSILSLCSKASVDGTFFIMSK